MMASCDCVQRQSGLGRADSTPSVETDGDKPEKFHIISDEDVNLVVSCGSDEGYRYQEKEES